MIEPGDHHMAAMAGGADCRSCPLANAGLGPVPPTYRVVGGRLPFLVVAEAPGPIEVDEGATLIGPSGREVRSALDAAGLDSGAASYTNAMLCRPPGGDLEAFLRKCKKEGLPSPIECCKPRLTNELAAADYALFIGGAAVSASGLGDSIMRIRGTPLVSRAGLATLHPAFVLRDQGRLMRPVFRADIAKAVRLFRGGNTWRDPAYTVVYDPLSLRAALNAMTDEIAVDTETDGIDPWRCRIRRIGLSDGITNVIFSPLSTQGHWMMNDLARAQCWDEISKFMVQPRAWYFHNYYGFDATVLEMHGVAVNEERLFDSLLGHHIGVTSEFPHSLGFLGSVHTDAPHWKTAGIHEKEDA